MVEWSKPTESNSPDLRKAEKELEATTELIKFAEFPINKLCYGRPNFLNLIDHMLPGVQTIAPPSQQVQNSLINTE